MTMEEITDPSVEMTAGGSKLDAPVSDYVIYDVPAYLDPGIMTLSFKWYKNITKMLNGQTKAAYTIHALDSTRNKFNSTPIFGRIIDSPLTETYSLNR